MGYGDPRRSDRYSDDEFDFESEDDYEPAWRPIRRRRSDDSRRRTRGTKSELRASRRPETESFRCRHCHMMVGPTVSGGRHRNHCPFCLYSRHVDGAKPGDRSSDCRSKMEPIGICVRGSGEQAIVHRCLGCGFERYNRVAADDNPALLAELPVVGPCSSVVPDDVDADDWPG